MRAIGSERMGNESEGISMTGIIQFEDRWVGLQEQLATISTGGVIRLTRSIVSIHDLMDSLSPYICLWRIGGNPTSRRHRDTTKEGRRMSTTSESWPATRKLEGWNDMLI